MQYGRLGNNFFLSNHLCRCFILKCEIEERHPDLAKQDTLFLLCPIRAILDQCIEFIVPTECTLLVTYVFLKTLLLLETVEPVNYSLSLAVVSKPVIFHSLKIVRLYRNMSEPRV
jgi:hypothetical protein